MHFCGEGGAAERKGERRSRTSNASCALYNACYVIVFPQFSPLFPTLSGVFTHLLAIIKASCRDVLATLQRISARCGKTTLRKTLARLLHSSSVSSNSNNCSLKLRQLCAALLQQWLKNNMNNLHMKRTHTHSYTHKKAATNFHPTNF